MTLHQLGQKLNEMYFGADDGEAAAMVHLFGIKYASEIGKLDASMKAIAKAAGIRESYGTEISKGVKLAKYASVKSIWAGAHMKKLLFPVMAFSVCVLPCAGALAASSRDVDKLTTCSVILGRAAACGGDIEGPSKRVGAWMDRVFPPGSSDQNVYLPVFMQGMQYHAQ